LHLHPGVRPEQLHVRIEARHPAAMDQQHSGRMRASAEPPKAQGQVHNKGSSSNHNHFLVSLFQGPHVHEQQQQQQQSNVKSLKPTNSYGQLKNEVSPNPSSSEDDRSAARTTAPSWLARKGSGKNSNSNSNSKPTTTTTATKGTFAGMVRTGKQAAGTPILGAVEDDWPMYSSNPDDYEMGGPIGYGATSVVRLATFKPLGQVVAVKVMEFEGRDSIQMMHREVRLMSLSKHPNILRVRGDWVSGAQLCIATRFIPPGSLLDISGWLYQPSSRDVTRWVQSECRSEVAKLN